MVGCLIMLTRDLPCSQKCSVVVIAVVIAIRHLRRKCLLRRLVENGGFGAPEGHLVFENPSLSRCTLF